MRKEDLCLYLKKLKIYVIICPECSLRDTWRKALIPVFRRFDYNTDDPL